MGEERSLEDVVKDIEFFSQHIKTLQEEATTASEQGNDEGLSTSLMRLARMNAGLGRQAAYAKYIARNSDRAARRYRAGRTLELATSMAVNKSQLQAELDSEEQFKVASDAQLVADEADDLTYRTDTFMKLGQSRLSLIKQDKYSGR